VVPLESSVDSQVSPHRSYEIAALRRGLSILDCFVAASGRSITVTEVARAVGIHRATVHRFLNTLASAGYIEPADRPGSWRYRPKYPTRRDCAPHPPPLELACVPVLRELALASGETVVMAVLYRGDVVMVQVVDGPQSVRVQQRVGATYPAHLTALGKVLLAGLNEAALEDWIASHTLTSRTPTSITSPQRLRAELADIRRTGYALDEQEFEVGLACVAAPICDAQGRTVAAITVSGPSGRVTYHRVPELSSAVVRAAGRLSAALEGLHPLLQTLEGQESPGASPGQSIVWR
jgi:DNA-binding IclR family transcriptional regulator